MKYKNIFIHLGGDLAVRSNEIIGVFDIEACSASKTTADFLNKSKNVVSVSSEMPKSFIVTSSATVISNVSNQTIIKRLKN